MSIKALIASILASLSLFPSTKIPNKPQVSETPIDYNNAISAEDYEGYSFRILSRPNSVSDQYIENPSGDIVDDAIYKRNKQVEDLFNIQIISTASSKNGFETDAMNAILAGDDAYDAVFAHSSAAFSYAVQGAVLNINDISSIHTEKPWWSQSFVDSCTVNDKLYALAGDISLQDTSMASCMFFNKRIFDEVGYEFPYYLASEGKWTFDEFQKLAKHGVINISNGKITNPNNFCYGFVTNEWQSPITVLYAGGSRIYDKDDENILELTLNNSRTSEIFKNYFEFIDSDYNLLCTDEELNDYDLFYNGHAAFRDGFLADAQKLREMNDNFGIVPLPKFKDSDSYATIVSQDANLVVIPVTVSNPERTGNIMEALCAIGSRDVIPTFFDKISKTKFSVDEESREMLNIIKDSIVYDLGYMSVSPFSDIGHKLAISEDRDFLREYAKNESDSLQKLHQFNVYYGDSED